jgi:hypothetical protein
VLAWPASLNQTEQVGLVKPLAKVAAGPRLERLVGLNASHAEPESKRNRLRKLQLIFRETARRVEVDHELADNTAIDRDRDESQGVNTLLKEGGLHRAEVRSFHAVDADWQSGRLPPAAMANGPPRPGDSFPKARPMRRSA